MDPNLAPSQQGCPHSRRRELDWQARLPRAWRERVVAPLDYEYFVEPSAHAWRYIGRDEEADTCFVRMQFALYSICCDDDDVFYERLDYQECLNSWRLRDGRWLIFREIRQGEACRKPQIFFTLSESCPR